MYLFYPKISKNDSGKSFIKRFLQSILYALSFGVHNIPYDLSFSVHIIPSHFYDLVLA